MRRSLFALAPLVLSAVALSCGGEAPPPATPPAPPIVMPPETITAAVDPNAPTAVDKAALDPAASPCDDFYQYACGGWIAATQIPGDEASWYRSFSVIVERNEQILHEILEGYAKGENLRDPYAKPLGDFYGSCMDEATIEKLGTKPLAPWLKAVEAVTDPTTLTKFLGRLQAELGSGLVFDQTAAQDFDDATRTVSMIWQGGLGMPEKEYYTDNSPKMTEIRTKYEAHVAAMMRLAGEPEAKAKASAKTVMAIETGLAKAWMSKEERREPKKINHRAAKVDLGNVAPGIAWGAWLEAAKSKDIDMFNIAQPDYMKELAAMLKGKVAIADWKTYLRWHLVAGAANDLGQKFVDERFKWRQALTGAATLPPRWKRCVRAIDKAMGEALGRPFVAKTLGAAGKDTVVGMVKEIEAAMHANLETLAWMDDATKKAAFQKLGKIANKISNPDPWRNYDSLEIKRDAFFLNAQHADAFEYARQLAKIGKPIDRTEWHMSPPTVNAYYDAQFNEMVFPAGILQPPFYSNDVPRPMNFGGIGMVMGHELTHGFDDEGRQFDADGNLKDWWTPKVNTEFEHRAECVQKQFDSYDVLGDAHVNGKLTLGENIADLGGIKLAYRALAAESRAHEKTPRGRFTPEQEFFLGFAQGWCGKLRDEALRNMVATNPHSPPNFRVNGPLSNLPEFAQAFSCKPGAKMVRQARCEVW